MSDPQAAAATLRGRGVGVEGPAPGRLEATASFSRGWQVLRFTDPEAAALPFLIRHDQAGEERRRLLAGPEGLAPHPLGARRVAAVTVAVADLAAGLRAYARHFDLQPAGEDDDAQLAARTARLPLASGASIILAAPHSPDHGPLAAALREQGEGLYAITLAVDDLPGAVRALRGRGLGVRVDEPGGVPAAAQLNHRQCCGARLVLVPAG